MLGWALWILLGISLVLALDWAVKNVEHRASAKQAQNERIKRELRRYDDPGDNQA